MRKLENTYLFSYFSMDNEFIIAGNSGLTFQYGYQVLFYVGRFLSLLPKERKLGKTNKIIIHERE